jgi:hypothetical protein
LGRLLLPEANREGGTVVERSVIEGRSVFVTCVDDELRPVARREATLLKIVFEDDGDVRYYATGRNKVPPRDPSGEGRPCAGPRAQQMAGVSTAGQTTSTLSRVVSRTGRGAEGTRI